VLLFSRQSFSQHNISVKLLQEECISRTEAELFRLINEYRKQKGLPALKLSVSLSYVARTHAKDQTDNYKQGKRCNMHSWSAQGSWTECCYTENHKQAECMWNKPRELTNYQGDGFEISFWSTYNYPTAEAFAKDILNGWKKSQGHNDVIVNKNTWKGVKWKVMGVGINGEYANVWFGKEEDPAGEPKLCE
jgi:hypothetical protein